MEPLGTPAVKMRCSRRSLESHCGGFVTIWFISILPIVFSLSLFLIFTFFKTETESEIQRICFREYFPAQRKTAIIIMKLLSQNPKSTQLHQEEAQAELQLEIAASSMDPGAIAAAEARLQIIKMQIVALDIYQKSLIAEAQEVLSQSEISTLSKAGAKIEAHFTKASEWLDSTRTFKNETHAKVGVLAESEVLAPTYKIDPEIDSKQRLNLTWRIHSLANESLRKFLPGKYKEEKTCAVIPFFENRDWIIRVGQDKFW